MSTEQSSTKKCSERQLAYQRRRYAENREKQISRVIEYQRKNPAGKAIRQKRWAEKNREKLKAYMKNYQERRKAEDTAFSEAQNFVGLMQAASLIENHQPQIK